MTDPIQTLRKYEPELLYKEWKDEWDAALTQVENLVRAANAERAARGFLRQHIEAKKVLDAALAPFGDTP